MVQRGEVYGDEVEEDEQDEHKPARVFNEPLKEPQRVANSDANISQRIP